MSPDSDDLRAAALGYSAALRAYLNGDGEEALEAAFAIGRETVASGHGVIDLAHVHALALAEALPELEGKRSCADVARDSCDVLAEGLASVEMMLLGFRESNQSLRRVNEVLEARVLERTRDLEQAQRRYRDLIESTPAVLYARRLSAPEEFVYMSPRLLDLLGFDPASWTPELALERVHPDDRRLVTDALRRSREEGGVLEVEYRLMTRDGAHVHVRDQAHMVEGAGGERLLHGVITDITRQVELKDQLVQAQKMEAVGRLAGGVAHDFNNLLTVILSFTRFVLDDLDDDDPRAEDLREVMRAADSAAGLTSQLLAFSRRRVVEARVINPNDAVARLDKMVRRTLGEGIEVSTLLADGMWSVHIDPGQLEQVVLNLVMNARDAMPEGGTVVLATRRRPRSPTTAEGPKAKDWVELSVTDTGTGMSDEVKARVFEPFFTTKGTRGTGLGLATCFGIVHQAGGLIEVESPAEGGTSMRVLLPRVDAAPDVAGEADDEEAAAPSTGTASVLVVEDQTALRRMMVRVLSDAGYQVHEAITAEEALELVEAGLCIDLLLTDVALPGMTGQRLASAVVARDPNVLVLVTSGYVEEDGLLAGRSPAAAFLAKPFTGAQLLHQVQELIDGRAPREPA